MGRLVKNHLARLIILTAAAYQVAAALEGFFWPKMFFDFLTHTLDGAVKPVPALQVINLLFGISAFALEWPLKFLAGSSVHRNMELRLMLLPLWALACVLMYQSTNAALYYVVGEAMYLWAYNEGEVICGTPWTLPKRRSALKGEEDLKARI